MTPDPEVVDLAEKLLRLARSGMATGFVAVIVLSDEDEVQTMDVGEYKSFEMIGQLELLKFKLVADLIENGHIAPSRPGPKAVEDASD